PVAFLQTLHFVGGLSPQDVEEFSVRNNIQVRNRWEKLQVAAPMAAAEADAAIKAYAAFEVEYALTTAAGYGLGAALRAGARFALKEAAERGAGRLVEVLNREFLPSAGTTSIAPEGGWRFLQRSGSIGEEFGPRSPRSPLGRDITESFPDPDPTSYENGLR